MVTPASLILLLRFLTLNGGREVLNEAKGLFLLVTVSGDQTKGILVNEKRSSSVTERSLLTETRETSLIELRDLYF